MSCAAVAYVALPNEDNDDDLIARDPRDDDLGGNAHERAATLHGFIGERYRVLAHAKPLPRSLDSRTTTKHREFGLFSDGTVARRDKKVQAKKESGETIVLNVPDAYIISTSTSGVGRTSWARRSGACWMKIKSILDKRRKCSFARRDDSKERAGGNRT